MPSGFDTDDYDVIHAIAQEAGDQQRFFNSWRGIIARLVMFGMALGIVLLYAKCH